MIIASDLKMIVLPNKELRDVLRSDDRLVVQDLMDGSIITHVIKRDNVAVYDWNVELTRIKAIEFIDFLLTEGRKLLTFDETFQAYILNETFDFEVLRRSVIASSLELATFNLKLEVVP